MKYIFRGALLAGFALLLTAVPALAHHSFAAEFDPDKTVTLTGTLAKVDWNNPHIYYYLDVKDARENVVRWSMESWPTGAYHRAGVAKDLFHVGDTFTAVVYVPRDGTTGWGYLKEITLPSGRKILLYDAKTGASFNNEER